MAEYEQIFQYFEGTFGFNGTGEPREVQRERLKQLEHEYYKSIKPVVLSRCPFCNQINSFSIDTLGIDGLVWRRDYRPKTIKDQTCPHFLNILGALKIHYPPHNSSLQVSLGPEVPFVVPKLMECEPVKAVISSIKVGEHIAYPIVYYSEVRPLLEYTYSR